LSLIFPQTKYTNGVNIQSTLIIKIDTSFKVILQETKMTVNKLDINSLVRVD